MTKAIRERWCWRASINRTVSFETVLLLVICLADTGHTLAVVRLGVAHEANPLVAWCLEHSNGMFVAFKLGLTALFLGIIEQMRLWHEGFIRKSLQVGIIGYSVVYTISSLLLALR